MDESRAKELLKAERERVEGELAKVRGEGREDSTAATPAGDFNNENLYEDEFAEGREGDLERRLEAEPLAELTIDEEPGGTGRW